MRYDAAIIGAGWAGFNAAKRLDELGLKVALIEPDKIGGTCLNRGCIPTKAFIQSAKIYSIVKKSKNFGIETASVSIDFLQIQARKEKIIQQLAQGIHFLLKGVHIVQGKASFIDKNTLEVAGEKIEASSIIIASGSQPYELKDLKFDRKKIVSSDEILNLQKIPASLLIVGGGVIGCEFASLFANLGSKVTVVEKMPQLLPGEDKEIVKKLETTFKKKGIKVNTNTDAAAVNLADFELVLVCVGRQAITEGLGLEKLGIKLEKGKIVTDEFLKTNIPNIYAVGDCTAKIMLAHFAAYQGVLAAENIAYPEKLRKCDNAVVPSCIFTDPEIASVGLKEETLAPLDREVKVNRFDFLGNGMARILDEADGFIKIISDEVDDTVLGASIIGPRATELIATLALAVNNKLTTEQIQNTIFAHPTLSESIHEALG